MRKFLAICSAARRSSSKSQHWKKVGDPIPAWLAPPWGQSRSAPGMLARFAREASAFLLAKEEVACGLEESTRLEVAEWQRAQRMVPSCGEAMPGTSCWHARHHMQRPPRVNNAPTSRVDIGAPIVSYRMPSHGTERIPPKCRRYRHASRIAAAHRSGYQSTRADSPMPAWPRMQRSEVMAISPKVRAPTRQSWWFINSIDT